MSTSIRVVGLLPVIALGLLVGAPARAAEKVRYDFLGAAGNCAPALPGDAAKLRSRPLALVNESTTTAFVTCTLFGDTAESARGNWQVAVNAANLGVVVASVTCTLVNGFASGTLLEASYNTKSVGLFPVSPGGFIAWVPAELAGAPAHIDRAAVSCALPPNTALHYVGAYYHENIGS